jgi:hypothetical protein
MKLIPSKGALVSGLIIFAAGMFLYNRVPQVKRILGGQ